MLCCAHEGSPQANQGARLFSPPLRRATLQPPLHTPAPCRAPPPPRPSSAPSAQTNALISAQVDKAIWDDCMKVKASADTKVKSVHYAQGDNCWLMLEEGPDGTPRLPKVPLTDDWLVFKNFADWGIEPFKNTFRNSLCTPYMYTKYSCIFGLTGSVGGDAEREYIKKTCARLSCSLRASLGCLKLALSSPRVMAAPLPYFSPILARAS